MRYTPDPYKPKEGDQYTNPEGQLRTVGYVRSGPSVGLLALLYPTDTSLGGWQACSLATLPKEVEGRFYKPVTEIRPKFEIGDKVTNRAYFGDGEVLTVLIAQPDPDDHIVVVRPNGWYAAIPEVGSDVYVEPPKTKQFLVTTEQRRPKPGEAFVPDVNPTQAVGAPWRTEVYRPDNWVITKVEPA